MKNFIALSVILITASLVVAGPIDHCPIEKPAAVVSGGCSTGRCGGTVTEQVEHVWAIDKDGKMVKVPVADRFNPNSVTQGGCANGKCPLPSTVQGSCTSGGCGLPSSGSIQGGCSGGSCPTTSSGVQGGCVSGSCQGVQGVSGVSRGFGSRMGFGSGSCGGFGSRLNWYPGKFMGRIFGR